MDYKKIAEDILKNLGGKGNINELTHCMTRLRIKVIDSSNVNKDKLSKIESVITVVESMGQLQVVIGNKVTKVYEEIIKLAPQEGNNELNRSSNKKDNTNLGNKILSTIAGIFTPVIPAIAGSGMIKGILSVLAMYYMNKHGINIKETQSYIILNALSDAVFYFMPIILGYTAAKVFKTNEIMVILVTLHKEISYIEELIKELNSNVTGIKSIIQNINDKDTNWVMGEECITLAGQNYITDYIGDFKFNISALSFFQVNPYQTEVLYNKALEYADLSGSEVVFDAYCGTGTITLFLSQKAKKVYGVEVIEQAIENAKVNATLNNVANAEFFVGKSEEVIPNLIGKGIRPNVIVVDPPRKGCDIKLLDSIGEAKPDRVVYVSCDPSTLARDLKCLEEKGYRTVKVQPVDMFPMTKHVESVVLLTRCCLDKKNNG